MSIGELAKMVPLTLEQLREMDGQPVYIAPTGFWALVIAKRGQRVQLICNDGERVWADKEIELVGPVYAYPPAHIDRSKWAPCDGCISCFNCEYAMTGADDDPCAHCIDCDGPGGSLQGSMNYFVAAGYCGHCGRPLTEEAWEELEKRLRG